MRALGLFIALVLTAASCAQGPSGSQQSGGRAQEGGKPGTFDYYVLALSWSPEFCFHERSSAECTDGKRRGFVVHGLWPQFLNGNYPENCSNAPGLSDPTRMLDIMPDPHLIAHEWSVHGTCSGLSADAYFDLIRKAFASIAIPAQFAAPSTQMTVTPETVKQDFEAKNPNLTDADIAIVCGGKYLTAVQICMSKTLNAVACPVPEDCRARTVVIAPVH